MCVLTRNELLRPRTCCCATVGLSGKERELDLFWTIVVLIRCDDPYPGIFWKVFSASPEPRREADAACAIFKFEQNEMFDLRRELCRSNVFCAENGDGRTKYLWAHASMSAEHRTHPINAGKHVQAIQEFWIFMCELEFRLFYMGLQISNLVKVTIEKQTKNDKWGGAIKMIWWIQNYCRGHFENRNIVWWGGEGGSRREKEIALRLNNHGIL